MDIIVMVLHAGWCKLSWRLRHEMTGYVVDSGYDLNFMTCNGPLYFGLAGSAQSVLFHCHGQLTVCTCVWEWRHKALLAADDYSKKYMWITVFWSSTAFCFEFFLVFSFCFILCGSQSHRRRRWGQGARAPAPKFGKKYFWTITM